MGDRFPASYRPDESSSVILAEHTWLQGAFLATVAYGIQFVLYVMTVFFLWKLRNRSNQKMNLFFIFYTSVIFIISTLYIAGMLEFTQEAFIDGRNIDGGPNAFENVMFSLPIDMLPNVIMVLNSWFCDIINVWRCFVVYKGCRVPSWLVNLIPMLLYLASIAFGILFLIQVGTVSQSPWAASGINFTIPYYSMSLALNIIVTILIVLRLLIYRWRITSAMGNGHGSQYTSLAAMIVESAAIYSAFALAFLIPFGLNSPIAQLFLQGLSTIQGVTTILIIFRVATGKGWSQEAYNTAMTSTAAAPISSFRARSRTGGSRTAFSSRQAEVSRDGAIMLGKMPSSNSDDFGSKESKSMEISKHVVVESV